MDLLYLGIGIAFFILSWGLIRLCERLGTDDPGEQA